jgi:CRP-like cAMP-binding protein
MTPVAAAKKRPKFDPQTFLSTIDGGRKKLTLSQKQRVFCQGDSADSVFYIQKGKVILTALSKSGKEATIGVLNEGDFFGEGCLTGQPLRMCSATAMSDCAVMRIDKNYMMEELHREHAFSDMFVAYLLKRNIRQEEDLVDQLFTSREKRLARVLLMLGRFGKDGKPEAAILKISQETLAEMIGTTRSRVNLCMNRFRKLGFVRYNGGLEIHNSLRSVVLHDWRPAPIPQNKAGRQR